MLESHLKSSSVPFSHDPISYGSVKETEPWVAGSIHLSGCPPGTKVCPEPQETPQHESWGHPGELMCRVDGQRAQRMQIKRNGGPRGPWSKLGCPTKGFCCSRWLRAPEEATGNVREDTLEARSHAEPVLDLVCPIQHCCIPDPGGPSELHRGHSEGPGLSRQYCLQVWNVVFSVYAFLEMSFCSLILTCWIEYDIQGWHRFPQRNLKAFALLSSDPL